ncbi:MAG: bifunctional [glutamine synthetase] adenylyltransferase/[glutamine synthetase]-adenylyl-L-tyrosine phosphorylase [Candidatus Nanopelagicales bacterium]
MTEGSPPRGQSSRGRLVRAGFTDATRAERLLSDPALAAVADDDEVLESLGSAADPDRALLLLLRVVEAATRSGAADEAHAMLAALRDDPAVRDRLLSVLGVSEALAEHLERHPDQWRVLADPEAMTGRRGRDELRAALLTAVGADPDDEAPVARGHGPEVLVDQRVAYRRALLALAARDLEGVLAFEDVTGELSDLADAVLEASLAIARAEVPEARDACRLAVIAMGKCGGRELNYISDVDVIFVAEPMPGADEAPALAAATRLATALMRATNASTPEGTIWEVDPNLRPEGRQGALVRTLASHLGYYDRWATTWEFQALLKARAAAGDADLGAAYVDAVAPLVWAAADRDGFVEDVQAMRRRVEDTIPSREADRQLKLGRGGLRDVEFSVQLLQLVHGRSDVLLRSPTTLPALEALATWGYVGREDASTLGAAYRFLRTLEHRIQLQRLRRSHLVPDDEADMRRLGRSLGFRTDPVGELTAEWRRHAREVRRLHEKLFYRPLLNAVARLGAGEARLTPEAAQERLEALGYVDPAGALRHLEALTAGVSRRAAIQRTLLPVMLGWFADAPSPDAGLLAFRQVSDALGATPWYLRLLRDESAAAERMARVLASSRYASALLLQAPEAVSMLADPSELAPRPVESLESEALSAVGRSTDAEAAVRAVRGIRRRELFRTAVAQILGLLEVEEVGEALSDVTTATIRGALQAAVRSVAQERGGKLPTRFCVVAMGRYGGAELGYGSDADVMFVHDPLPGADEKDAADAALAVATELRRLLMAPSADPPLEIDADLRPEGRQGPLVRTLASYAAYYARWSSPWEAQALLRARPVAGDGELGERFEALVDPLRYPSDGVDEAALREMRRLKARMESERLPRGADPALHTKLGRGGLTDVEWVAQLLQLQHAHDVPALRSTRTVPVLRAAAAAGLLDPADPDVLASAWRTATRVRDAVMLVRGRAGDQVPGDVVELAGVSRLLGYPPGGSGRLVEDYKRVTRRARSVVERVFYGE